LSIQVWRGKDRTVGGRGFKFVLTAYLRSECGSDFELPVGLAKCSRSYRVKQKRAQKDFERCSIQEVVGPGEWR
jgi:hypothetical protein